jgi:hypothetical protein
MIGIGIVYDHVMGSHLSAETRDGPGAVWYNIKATRYPIVVTSSSRRRIASLGRQSSKAGRS